jgi:hypothetical protein
MIQNDLEFARDVGNHIFQDHGNAVGKYIDAFYMEHVICSSHNPEPESCPAALTRACFKDFHEI